MSITELVAFEEVSSAIGKEEALEELSKVFPDGTDMLDFGVDLLSLFTWEHSPQGHDFWMDIHESASQS